MNPQNGSSYQLDIYTDVACYRGHFNEAYSRRMSDILNDRSHSFLVLENAQLILWDDGTPQGGESVGTITVVKRNTIAVVVGNLAQIGRNGSQAYHVDKTPSRVTFYTPSLEVVGDIHMPKGAELLNILDSTHMDFLPLTCTAIRWLDCRAPLPISAGLMFLNRNLISGIRPLVEAASNSVLIEAANILD